MSDLKVGGKKPEVGLKIRVLTRYGEQIGQVSSTADRVGTAWIAYVVPVDRPREMMAEALWELNSADVPWTPLNPVLGEVEEPVVEPVVAERSVETTDLVAEPARDELPPEKLFSGIEVTTEKIIEALRELESAGKSDLLTKSGLTEVEWPKAMKTLLDSGVVTKTGEKRGTRYKLAVQGAPV